LRRLTATSVAKSLNLPTHFGIRRITPSTHSAHMGPFNVYPGLHEKAKIAVFFANKRYDTTVSLPFVGG